MDPITSQMFSYDYARFVLQEPNMRTINYEAVPKPKLFKIEKEEKPTKSRKKSSSHKQPHEDD